MDRAYAPNALSRALPVISIVFDGHLNIDPYEKWTMDKSVVNGHFYSDKAPFSTFFVVPFFALMKALNFVHKDPLPLTEVLSAGAIFAGSVPFLGILILTMVGLAELTPSFFIGPAYVATAFYGTFVYVYSATYFGHLLSAFFLLFAWVLLRRIFEQGRAAPQMTSRVFFAGLALGFGVMTEYPLAIAAVVFLAALTFYVRKLRTIMAFCLGLLPAAVALGVYNYATTGHVTTVSYGYVSDTFAFMHKGYGFGIPKFEALVGLLTGWKHGAFLYAPILIVYAFVFVFHLRKALSSSVVVMSSLSLIYVIAMSGYGMWSGGAAYGPRHLVPIATLWIYEGVIFTARKEAWLAPCFVVGSLGFLLSWFVKGTFGFWVREDDSFPLTQQLLPAVNSGDWATQSLPSILFGANAKFSVMLWPLLFLGLAWLTVWFFRPKQDGTPMLERFFSNRTGRIAAFVKSDHGAWVVLFALLCLGVIVRLLWPAMMEWKADEMSLFDQSQRFARGLISFPWIGVMSSRGLHQGGLSCWPYLLVGYFSNNPLSLVRAVQIEHVTVIILLFLTFFFRLKDERRLTAAWTLALWAVAPLPVLYGRKIWEPTFLPLFTSLFLVGFLARRRFLGALLFGMAGACLGQIHLSGSVYFVAFLIAAFFFQGAAKTCWFGVFVGIAAGLLPGAVWLSDIYLRLFAEGVRGVASHFDFSSLYRLEFYQAWFKAAFGLDIAYYALDSRWIDLFRQDVVSAFCVFFGVVAYATLAILLCVSCVSLLRRWLAVRNYRRPDLTSPVTQLLFASFCVFGVMMVVFVGHLYPHYLIVSFPLPQLFAVMLVGRRPRRLMILGLSQAVITISFIVMVKYGSLAIHGEYGNPYERQSPQDQRMAYMVNGNEAYTGVEGR